MGGGSFFMESNGALHWEMNEKGRTKSSLSTTMNQPTTLGQATNKISMYSFWSIVHQCTMDQLVVVDDGFRVFIKQCSSFRVLTKQCSSFRVFIKQCSSFRVFYETMLIIQGFYINPKNPKPIVHNIVNSKYMASCQFMVVQKITYSQNFSLYFYLHNLKRFISLHMKSDFDCCVISGGIELQGF